MLLLFATLLVPLVFLNLLIALISEAFAIVNENLLRSDYAELVDIILELEEFMFWNAGQEAKCTHLVVAQHANHTKPAYTSRSTKMAQKVKVDLDNN